MTSVSTTVASVVLLVCLALGIMMGVMSANPEFSVGNGNINKKALRGRSQVAPEQRSLKTNEKESRVGSAAVDGKVFQDDRKLNGPLDELVWPSSGQSAGFFDDWLNARGPTTRNNWGLVDDIFEEYEEEYSYSFSYDY